MFTSSTDIKTMQNSWTASNKKKTLRDIVKEYNGKQQIDLKLHLLARKFHFPNDIAIYGSQIFHILSNYPLYISNEHLERQLASIKISPTLPNILTIYPNFLKNLTTDSILESKNISHSTEVFSEDSDIDIVKQTDPSNYEEYAIWYDKANKDYKFHHRLYHRLSDVYYDIKEFEIYGVELYHNILGDKKSALDQSRFIKMSTYRFKKLVGYKQLPYLSKKEFDSWMCVCNSLETCFDNYHSFFVGDSMLLIYKGDDIWKLILKNNIGPFTLEQAIEYNDKKILVPTIIPNLSLSERIDRYYQKFIRRVKKKMRKGYRMNGELLHYFLSPIFPHPLPDNLSVLICVLYRFTN